MLEDRIEQMKRDYENNRSEEISSMKEKLIEKGK